MNPLNLLNRWSFSGVFIVGGLLMLSACRPSKEPSVAKVGTESISLSDFKERLQQTPPAYQQYVTTPEGRRQFLNLLIRERVLLAEARKAGLHKEEKYRKSIDEYKTKAQRELKDYENGLLVQMELARLRSKDLSVTDPEIRKYYDDHSQDFQHPIEIQASHILVRTPEEAENAIIRLKRGESFEAVARAVSMDPPTAARGGKLDPFTRGSLMPEFENAVYGLKDGQISAPVKSAFGYHVIKKTGQRALPARSFEQAKEEIQNRLQREKFDQWATQAQTSAGVKIDEKALSEISVAANAPEPGGMP